MAYREINRGSTANDGTGDDARAWSSKTNENMKELFSNRFTLNDWEVSRNSYDPNDLSFDAFKNNDKIKGWADAGETHWIEGILLNVSALTVADDITEAEIDDKSVFFKTNEAYKEL
jgi:hypothetical protein